MSEEKKTISIKDEIEQMETVDIPLEQPDSIWLKIINAESPDKKIPEYTTHPLNYDHKQSTGRIIRGLEGMIGNLDRALVDMIMGVVQKVLEIGTKKETQSVD